MLVRNSYLIESGTEWVVRITTQRFHCIVLVAGVMFVGVEFEIHTIREVIFVDGHTLKEVRPINHDSNLCVVVSTKRQILHTRTNIDDTISILASLICIPNRNAARAYRDGRKVAVVRSTTIIGLLIGGELNLVAVLGNLTECRTRSSQGLDGGQLTRTKLGDFDVMYYVAFLLESSHSSTKLGITDVHPLGSTEVILITHTNVNVLLLGYLLL